MRSACCGRGRDNRRVDVKDLLDAVDSEGDQQSSFTVLSIAVQLI